MEAMRSSWTDDRLDDFGSHVDQRFDQVDQRFEQMEQRFDQVDQRFDRVEAELRTQRIETRAGFDKIDVRLENMAARFDSQLDAVRHLILQVGGGVLGTLVVGILTVLAMR